MRVRSKWKRENCPRGLFYKRNLTFLGSYLEKIFILKVTGLIHYLLCKVWGNSPEIREARLAGTPITVLMRNYQPGKGGRVKRGTSLESWATTRDLELTPPEFHGTLLICSQGKMTLERFLRYKSDTVKFSTWTFHLWIWLLTLDINGLFLIQAQPQLPPSPHNT